MQLGIYKHYKGNLYQVIGIARHTETLEEMVIYQSLYGDYGLWARPVLMFNGKVEGEKGKYVPRFEFIREACNKAPDFR